MSATELHWFKSSYSSSEVDDCVETAPTPTPTTIHVRDSKTTTAPHLTFPLSAWAGFVSYVSTASESRPLRPC